MMATVIAGVAQFERELIQERIRSGMAAAKARGRKLGRQPGQRPKSDRLAPKVIRMVEEEKLSYRIVAKRLDLSKNTVLEIMKRHRRTIQGLDDIGTLTDVRCCTNQCDILPVLFTTSTFIEQTDAASCH